MLLHDMLLFENIATSCVTNILHALLQPVLRYFNYRISDRPFIGTQVPCV